MVAAAAVAFGVTHRAAYPPTGLRQVYAQVLTQVRPSDVIVLDGYESFTYGDEQLGPWTVSFHQGTVPWPMGFHVASRAAKVVLSREYLQPDAQITTLQTRTHRIFFVGPTVGGYSTSAPSDLWPLFFPTPTRLAISKFPLFACPGFDRWINVRAPSQGTPQWLPTRVYCPSGAGTYAELFVWR